MQQRADGQHFRVVLDRLELPDPLGKQPGPNDMVEQVWLASFMGIVQGALNERCPRDRNSGKCSRC
jgi:hypothetical protein